MNQTFITHSRVPLAHISIRRLCPSLCRSKSCSLNDFNSLSRTNSIIVTCLLIVNGEQNLIWWPNNSFFPVLDLGKILFRSRKHEKRSRIFIITYMISIILYPFLSSLSDGIEEVMENNPKHYHKSSTKVLDIYQCYHPALCARNIIQNCKRTQINFDRNIASFFNFTNYLTVLRWLENSLRRCQTRWAGGRTRPRRYRWATGTHTTTLPSLSPPTARPPSHCCSPPVPPSEGHPTNCVCLEAQGWVRALRALEPLSELSVFFPGNYFRGGGGNSNGSLPAQRPPRKIRRR